MLVRVVHDASVGSNSDYSKRPGRALCAPSSTVLHGSGHLGFSIQNATNTFAASRKTIIQDRSNLTSLKDEASNNAQTLDPVAGVIDDAIQDELTGALVQSHLFKVDDHGTAGLLTRSVLEKFPSICRLGSHTLPAREI
ncbi:hypothetical protein PAXINDRAFT_20543 [Paxillus involutus ATCC 200175]|uniref:Uncharacterized protein n=1 Tax=Paxillus involutus ATCC 200175 TaxID=664439 RepID=A0A0C9SUT7_PAXIN|nr:hypothetical protein PAXINDRAFT_20543 [Paxillus involutus ATCC 200175]